jgi:predicted acyl esterase
MAVFFALALAFSGSASLVMAAAGTHRHGAAGESVSKPKTKQCKNKKTKKARKKCRQNKGGGENGGGSGGGGGSAEPLRPMDYIAEADTLSQPLYPQTVTEILQVEAFDGEDLYLEVTRPDPAVYGETQLPVILEASPYHGTLANRIGDRMFPDPKDAEGNTLGLTGYFAPRGYAVVMFDLRGTGRSTGCLDHLGQKDAKDLETVIEWLAVQPWSNGRIGMTGHSYVGSTPSVAAAQAPDGLVTIVPSAGLASMYDHQFNKGVPWLLQWVGPMYAYPQLALYRDLPAGVPPPPVVGGGPSGDNFENAPNPQIGCGTQNSALTAGHGQVNGEYQLWHAQRDWRQGAADADIPIFMIHGVNDNAARIPAAEWFFEDRGFRPGDKVWLGQWDHGSTNGRCGDPEGNRVSHPTCRFDQMKYAIHAWFDKHLMQRDVDTGPPVEVFLNEKRPLDVTRVIDPESLQSLALASDEWEPRVAAATLYPDATDMSLGFSAPTDDGSASFGTTANGVLAHIGERLTFTSGPVTEDTVFVGVPKLRLDASVSADQIVHLVTTLYRVDQGGRREPMNFCAIQPQLRHGVHQTAPVIPGEEMELPLQCFTMAHWLPAGQHLELVVQTSSPHHATFGTHPEITVYTGPDSSAYVLPYEPSATLFRDVRLRESTSQWPPPAPTATGPAQPGASGTVTLPAPGGGFFLEPVNAAGFEFEVLEGYDNASMNAIAVPSSAADLDIYLERRLEDGSWEGVTAGESSSFESESLTSGRLEPGAYRILVHNWAGPPVDAEVTISFFNGADEPGAEGAETTPTQDVILARGSFGLLQP